jgi:hypothetical protein
MSVCPPWYRNRMPSCPGFVRLPSSTRTVKFFLYSQGILHQKLNFDELGALT